MHTALRQVHVRVPATTANLGSGFDILGLALQLYNVFTLTMTSKPGWRVSLPPGARLPTDTGGRDPTRAAPLTHYAHPPGTRPG